MDKPIVMYFVMNSDLNMSKGKCCSQIAHATQEITERIIRSCYESKKPPEYYLTYMKWKMGSAKIVLKAPEEKLKELMKLDHCIAIRDAGRTQVNSGSLTCIGFYPSTELGDVLKDLKLL